MDTTLHAICVGLEEAIKERFPKAKTMMVTDHKTKLLICTDRPTQQDDDLLRCQITIDLTPTRFQVSLNEKETKLFSYENPNSINSILDYIEKLLTAINYIEEQQYGFTFSIFSGQSEQQYFNTFSEQSK